ncbi:NAD-dependent malic enzyme, mitochondrial [Borealophlyctis nickersoniae]|nr:NAD-dependent malic enzyme, mitochondrial [Borealophlyctis nickersoniae]
MPKQPVYRFSNDPQTGKPVIYTTLGPREILNTPLLNKGTAFPREERERLGLEGALPHEVLVLNQQVARAYGQYVEEKGELQKNAFLQTKLDQNEVLFHKLLTSHLEEMLPIIYTPTQGDAIENYPHMFRRPRGLFLTLGDKGQIDRLVHDALPERTNLIVVTDSEEILGAGDQGVGGIFISVAKLLLYSALGGVNPSRVLPVVLDVGTDNEKLLNDELYPGWRHKRVRGEEYFAFVDEFVQVVKRHVPDAMLHWEDFGRETSVLARSGCTSSLQCPTMSLFWKPTLSCAWVAIGLRCIM